MNKTIDFSDPKNLDLLDRINDEEDSTEPPVKKRRGGVLQFGPDGAPLLKYTVCPQTPKKSKVKLIQPIVSRKAKKKPTLKDYVRDLRSHPTRAETALLYPLKELGFEFQVVVLHYIPDFVHWGEKVIVEVDGGYHTERDQVNCDMKRDQNLREYGWRVIRFTNERALQENKEVVKEIKSYLAALKKHRR